MERVKILINILKSVKEGKRDKKRDRETERERRREKAWKIDSICKKYKFNFPLPNEKEG